VDARPVAVILAGGVAKGAFEAGAIQRLVEAGLPIDRVVAASSGALNGTYLAAAIHSGREREAAENLPLLWLERASYKRVFDIDVAAAARLSGLSNSDRLIDLMRDEVGAIRVGPAGRPVNLSVVVAVIGGVTSYIGGQPTTSYEKVLTFDGAAFDDEAQREVIYRATAASAAFPLVFKPVDVPGVGPSYDGGVVNDTPVELAMEYGAERIIVISPYPQVVRVTQTPTGIAGVAHLADILIHERLFRDLRDAEAVNRKLERLEALAARGTLTAAQLEAVREVTGWRRRVDLTWIRPDEDLPGSPFAGFFSRSLRLAYVEAGRKAAESALRRPSAI
jgi:NTE family protein